MLGGWVCGRVCGGSRGGGRMRSMWNGMLSLVKAPDLSRNFAKAGSDRFGSASRWGCQVGFIMS